MKKTKKGRKVALVAGLALVALSVAMAWTYREEIRSWYEFRQLFESLGKNEQGRPEYRHWQTGIVFIGLPGGTFHMGSPGIESDRYKDEGPVHKVTLSPFLIAKYEVSFAQWKEVMGVNYYPTLRRDTLPMETVSWEDCQEFCTKSGLSLPTEAQWEYACRAGTSGPYAGTGKLDDMGWYRKNHRVLRGLDRILRPQLGGETHPVGEKQPNQFGLHDMHGNVWEWCEDLYDSDFYRKPEAREPDPVATSGSDSRVGRGGSCSGLVAGICRSAYRRGTHPSSRYNTRGFRPAWSSP